MASDRMTFRKFGRSYHLKIDDVKDLKQVLTLEEALWVATGAPVAALNCDPVFLGHVDSDKNGRIMSSEVKNAVKWLLGTLKEHGDIKAGNSTLETRSINTETPEGRRISDFVRRVLKQPEVESSGRMTLEQVRNLKQKLESAPVSGAGLVVPEASKDGTVKEFIADVISVVGGLPHPGGEEGISKEKMDVFFTHAGEYVAWHDKGSSGAGNSSSGIMPLGNDTAKAFKSFSAVRDKVEKYFNLCMALSFEPDIVECEGMFHDCEKVPCIGEETSIEDLLKRLPVARTGPEAVLRLNEGINPCYTEHIRRFREDVVCPLLGDVNSIQMSQWQDIKQAFAEHDEWLKSKKGTEVEKLGVEKLKTYLSDGKFRDCITKLIKESFSAAISLDDVCLVEKLILYQAGISDLVNNFVSFPYLYDPACKAAFEMGTLIIDGRYLNFSIKVDNRAEHVRQAKTSDIFIVYAEITPCGGTKYEIAAPVTSGNKGNLCLGKRGVFRDIKGNISDARIVEIIENPISICETLVAPFQRIGRLISGRIEALTLTAEKKLDATAAATTVPAQAGAQGSQGLLAGGLLMGGGVALAALGSAMAYMANTLKGVSVYKIIFGLVCAVLAVIMPASVMAMLKLRRRDLSAILEGSGWAINTRMRLTFRQGRLFTQQSVLPKGSHVGGLRSRALLTVWLIVMLLAGVYLYIALRRLSG